MNKIYTHWLPVDSRNNLLQVSGAGDWSDSEEVVLESVWQDKSMDLGKKSRTHNFIWGPEGELNLALGHLAFNLNWEGGMDRHLNTGSNELPGEG